MRRKIQSPKRLMRIEDLRITSNALDAESALHASLANPSAGVYNITLLEPLGRRCLVVAQPRTASRLVRVVSTSATGCVINCFQLDGTTAAACDLDLLLIGSEVADYT